MRVTALRSHNYDRVIRRNGDSYEARDQDVNLIVALNWVKVEAGQKPAQVTELPASEIIAAAHDEFAAEEKQKPRKYKRRDMVPED